MSTPFIPPAANQLQRLAFYQELQLAYSERAQALGGDAAAPLTVESSWQSLGMYQAWQNWLEANCTSFIDHVNGPLLLDGSAFLYFTLAAWRAAAGLNASGFRRFDANGNSLGYGIAQDDDGIVPGVFQDLQAGFSALKMLPFASRALAVKSLFPSLITAGINAYTGNITQPGSQYNGGVNLGNPGVYNIVWNGQDAFAEADLEYISIGKGAGGPVGPADDFVRVVNDSKEYDDPELTITYAASLTFADAAYVKVHGYTVDAINVISHSASFTDITISTSSVLPAENAPIGTSFLAINFAVTIEPPWTNSN